jgi:Flp pilus assembly protein TadG
MNITRSRVKRPQENGAILVLVSVGMIALLGFAALSIDISHLYQEQRDLQSATDASALAGAGLLITDAGTSSAIRNEAQNLAQANGISSNEIAASTVGAIQVGQWDGTNFTAGTTPYNAVRVPAKRTVGLFFGPLLGLIQKYTEVHSVAALSSPNEAMNLAPFMLRQDYVTANGFGVPFDISHNTYKATGDFGPLDLSGSSGSLNAQMTGGCNCTVTTGEVVSEHTGNNADYGMIQAANNTTVVMPIVTSLGNHTATVTGFAVVLITNAGGNHGNWTATFTIENELVGTGTGGTAGFPFAKDRVLVQ